MKSSFFSRGYYKKPGACPRVFDSDGKWDVERSVAECNLPVSADHPLLVEEKYNGNRGIFEFKDGRGCLHSGKKGCHENGFPAKVARLIEQQFSITNDIDAGAVEEVLGKEFAGKIKGMQKAGKIHDVILDGEMYLEDCNGKIPGLATQARAIKGSHPDLERDCIFSYKVYDIIKLNGKDVTRFPLTRRKELLLDVLPYAIMNSGEGVSVEAVKGTEVSSAGQISDIASALVKRGNEGIVVKDPASKYDWKGRDEDRPDTAGWWKVKNATSIDATVTSACLGNPGKTGINAFRYKLFSLGACKDKACNEIVPITTKGVSHSATGGEFSGEKKWNDNLHVKVIDAIGSGKAKPGKGWRVVTKATTRLQRSGDFDGLIGGMAKNGEPGLPRCVSIEPGTINVTVAGLEFNIDKHGNPKINGPPLLVKSAKKISTIKEIMELPSVHV